jgi:signal transduction histidine kinase
MGKKGNHTSGRDPGLCFPSAVAGNPGHPVAVACSEEPVPHGVLWQLQERVKELSALHRVAGILQNDHRPLSRVLQEIVGLLPPAWQFPEVAVARISIGHLVVVSAGFSFPGCACQEASFTVSPSGKTGKIEVIYLAEKPSFDEGPFLQEERSLIDSVAQLVQAYLDRWLYRRALKKHNQRLEREVRIQTRELRKANQALTLEIRERRGAERKNRSYKEDLQKLVSELARAEEEQRRQIAEDLHDHLGQALAILKLKLLELHGEAIFYGLEARVEEINVLLKKIIAFTRSLTAEICPPVLYELGLSAAIEWLGDRFQEKYGLVMTFRASGVAFRLANEVQVPLFRAVRELLTNVVKHAQTSTVGVFLDWEPGKIQISVADQGRGFDPTFPLKKRLIKEKCFGLFHLRERLRFLGGSMNIESKPCQGTCVLVTLPVVSGRIGHGQ